MLRRIAAEGLGSLLLAATVIGSGIMAERLAAGNLAVALIANTGATVAVLATLIALLGPLSGAHFNPAVSLVQALRGASRRPMFPHSSLRSSSARLRRFPQPVCCSRVLNPKALLSRRK